MNPVGEIERLRDQLRAAREEIAALKRDAAGESLPGGVLLGLTRREALLLGLLMAREIVARESAWQAFYGADPDAKVDPAIFSVFVRHMRVKLRAFGVEIVTVHRVGWRMPPDSKARIRAALAERLRA